MESSVRKLEEICPLVVCSRCKTFHSDTFTLATSRPSPSASPVVAIIEDNDRLRRAMARVLESAGFEIKSFASVLDFVNSGMLARLDCLVLDIGLPGIDGLRLQ